jgi:hypothetical protein
MGGDSLMRIRSVKPEFWRDEITGLTSCETALFYLGLAGCADDSGRFHWDARLIRADLDPYDAKWGGPEGIEKQLRHLEKLGRIFRYEAGGRVYGWIPTQKRHQKPNHPTESTLPEPPRGLREHYRNPNVELPAGEERRGEEAASAACAETPVESSAPASPENPSPVVAVLPVVGKGPREYQVTAAKVAEWQDAYPGVDVVREVKALVQWSRDNPTRRKTFKGAAAFLSRNLARKQDKNPAPRRVNGNADPAILAALADAERDAANPEPHVDGEVGDRGALGSEPLDPPEDGMASLAAALPAQVREDLARRRSAGELQNPARAEPGARHGEPAPAGAVRDARADDRGDRRAIPRPV